MRIRYHFNNNHHNNNSSSTSSNNTVNRNNGSIHRRPRRSTTSPTSEEPQFSRRANTMNEIHFYLTPTPVSSSSSDDDNDHDINTNNNSNYQHYTRLSSGGTQEQNLDEAMEAGLIQHPRLDSGITSHTSNGSSTNDTRRQSSSWRNSNTNNNEQRALMNTNTNRSPIPNARAQRASTRSDTLAAVVSGGSNNSSNITSYFTFTPSSPTLPLLTSSLHNGNHDNSNNLTPTRNAALSESNSTYNAFRNSGTDTNNLSNVISNNTATDTNTANNNVDDEEWDTILDTEDITQLTTRLRCLFAMLTCPIVPLAATLTLLLLWVLYSALLLDWGKPCDQPLRAYALLSAAMFAYTPHHRTAKRILFGYLRERDGPTRPWGVRVYDQMYHAACLLWMYAGISWTSRSTTCAQTCPHLFKSTKVFVLVQTTFMSILVIPLLCLPCIYLWLVRQAAVISANRRLLRRRKRVPPEKVIASFITIDLSNETIQQFLQGKECCICMSDFMEEIHHSTSTSDIVPAVTTPSSADAADNKNNGKNDLVMGVIQTQCGHLFHRACIATWLKTPYSGSYKCPLCREDLIPPGLEATENGESSNSNPDTSLNNEETKEEESVQNEISGEQQSLLPAILNPNSSRQTLPSEGFGSTSIPSLSSPTSSWQRMAGSSSSRSRNNFRSEDQSNLNLFL